MRAKEFIPENQMHDWHKQGIPGMRAILGTNQYYELYRLGLAMAAAGREDDPPLGEHDGAIDDCPATLSYTKEDDKIIKSALKRAGKSSAQITSQTSQEPTDTNTQSPMQPRGPVRRKKS